MDPRRRHELTRYGAPTAFLAAVTIAGAQYYLIKSGDTLGGIAAQYHTTVEELMRLNPQLDPTALRPGTQIRVS